MDRSDYEFFDKYGYLPNGSPQKSSAKKRKPMPYIIALLVLVVLLAVGGILVKSYVTDTIAAAKQERFDTGYEKGKATGYMQGYAAGKADGYRSGYAAAENDAEASDDHTPQTIEEWEAKYFGDKMGSN